LSVNLCYLINSTTKKGNAKRQILVLHFEVTFFVDKSIMISRL